MLSIAKKIHPELLVSDFHDGPVAKSPPANAGDTGLIPSLGRCHLLQSYQAQAPQLPQPCSRTWEPQLLSPGALEPRLHHKRSHCNEKPAHRNQRVAPACCTMASSCTTTKTQCSSQSINERFSLSA